MPRRSSIEQLPRAVRDWLDRALVDGNFSDYRMLEEALHSKGFHISKSVIHRYGQKIERRFAAIKASTEAARMLTEGAADDCDARSEAVIALVQTELFESIVNLQEATDEDIDPAERIGLLSSAAKNIATLSRASVNLKKFQAEVRARVEAAAAAVDKVVKTGGLSDDAADVIRRQILGIAS
jgi:hypothetical protein